MSMFDKEKLSPEQQLLLHTNDTAKEIMELLVAVASEKITEEKFELQVIPRVMQLLTTINIYAVDDIFDVVNNVNDKIQELNKELLFDSKEVQ